MSCCKHCEGADDVFRGGYVKEELEAYRKNGASNTTRMLLEGLTKHKLDDMTLLDIGGGVGAIPFALFNAGIRHAVGIDASQGYIRASKMEAEVQGVADRLTHQHGDFVALADDIEEADIVTLDRVVCCYPDMPALLNASADHAKRWVGMVYPRENLFTRLGIKLLNLTFWVRGNPFRVFVHPNVGVHDIMSQKGFGRVLHKKTLLWQVMLYERV